MKKRIIFMLVVTMLATSLFAVPAAATEEQPESSESEQTESFTEEGDTEDYNSIDENGFDTEIKPDDEAEIVLSGVEGQTDNPEYDDNEDPEIDTENPDDSSEEAEFTEEESEETPVSTSLNQLGAEYADSDVRIGDAFTIDNLTGDIATFASSTTNCDTIKVSGTINYTYAYQVLDLVNEERAAQGLSALNMDTDLLNAAMQRAAETSIYWSHTRPSGQSCNTVSSKVSGENIAAGSSIFGPEFIMYQWMNSSGHRANILSSSYKSIGIGVFVKDGYIYWVQDFGTSSATSVSKSGSSTQTYSIDINPDTIQSSLSLSASTTSLTNGSSTTLTAKILNTEMSVYTTIENSSLKWSSSDTSVATVNSSGKVTAVGNGSTKITSKTNGGKMSASVTITSSSGELKKVNGVWGYYKNGTLQTSYTGFAVNSSGKWYVEKGIVTKSTNGVFKDKDGAIGTAGNWYYVLNSKVQTGFTGLANYKNSSGWWYITKGKVDRSYTGLAKNKNGWFYVKNGKVDRSYTGFASNSSGKWYVSSGKVTKTKNGVIKDSKGAIGSKNAWYYVLNSKVQTGFTGLANYSNSSGWWYITKGKVDRSYNGLAKNKNGWFYLTNGKVNRSFTGLATNSNGTWYVKSGKVQKSYTGTVTINGKKYSVKNGKV